MKGKAGTTGDVQPPPHLSAAERAEWDYYAPLLAAVGRLTMEARGVLANYCVAQATVARLKAQQAAPEYRDIIVNVTVDGAGNEHVKAAPNPLLLRLEKWLALCHTYENDLGFNPATAVRMPAPDTGEQEDASSEFFGGLRAV
jgi:phage terminase small subunit